MGGVGWGDGLGLIDERERERTKKGGEGRERIEKREDRGKRRLSLMSHVDATLALNDHFNII